MSASHQQIRFCTATDGARLVRTVHLGASALIRLSEIERGIEWTRRALTMAPNDPGVVWKAACAFARAGRLDDSPDCLERAITLDSVNWAWVDHDPDVDPVRNHPRFRALRERMD